MRGAVVELICGIVTLLLDSVAVINDRMALQRRSSCLQRCA